jgi:hypothetical protein
VDPGRIEHVQVTMLGSVAGPAGYAPVATGRAGSAIQLDQEPT